MKLGNRFLIPTLSIITLGMILSTSVSYIKSRNAIVKIMDEQLEQRSMSMSESISSLVKNQNLNIKLMSQKKIILTLMMILENDLPAKSAIKMTNEVMSTIKEDYKYYESISIINLEGKVILSTYENLNGNIQKDDLECFKESLNGESCISQIFRSPQTNKPVYSISYPLIDEGDVVGVLYCILSLEYIYENIVKPVEIGKTGFSYIMNNNGIILAHHDKSLIFNDKVQNYFDSQILVKKKGRLKYVEKNEKKLLYYLKNEYLEIYCIVTTSFNELLIPSYSLAKINISFALLIMLIVWISIFVNVKSTIKPINKLLNHTNIVSKGDFTRQVKINRKDEIANLFVAINTIVNLFRKTLLIILSKSKLLADSSNKMLFTYYTFSLNSNNINIMAENVANTSEKTLDNIKTIVSKIKEMNDNILHVSDTSAQISKNITSVASSIDRLSESMKGIGTKASSGTRLTENAVSFSRDTGDLMASLKNSTNGIGGVSKLIKRIAYQTNILALNASIEASKAGESGKGFSVIAKAIEDFAHQISSATEDITKKVLEVQDKTTEVEKAISKISNIIFEINTSSRSISQSVENQIKTANKIATNALEADNRTSAIARSMEKIAQGSQNVSQSISEIAQRADEVTANIKEVSKSVNKNIEENKYVNSSAADLKNLAEELERVVSRYRIN